MFIFKLQGSGDHSKCKYRRFNSALLMAISYGWTRLYLRACSRSVWRARAPPALPRWHTSLAAPVQAVGLKQEDLCMLPYKSRSWSWDAAGARSLTLASPQPWIWTLNLSLNWSEPLYFCMSLRPCASAGTGLPRHCWARVGLQWNGVPERACFLSLSLQLPAHRKIQHGIDSREITILV